MRKIILMFLAVFIQFSIVYAADGQEGKFSLDAGFTWVNNPSFIGGHFDFGMVLYKKVLYIQNNFLLRAGGLNIQNTDYGIFTLSEKIIFGRNSASLHRTTSHSIYTYGEAGIGIYGNEGKEFFKDQMAYTFGFGGGIESSYEQYGAIYFEVGYLGQKINSSYPIGGVILQTGMRIFF